MAPVIGILCVDIAKQLSEKYNENGFKSYVGASSVKFLESAGAKVVPIWIGRTREYYENILQQINGVLLPGGAVWFHEPGGFADAGRQIFDIAIEMNERGDFFPLLGICLGYELLLDASAKQTEVRRDCAALNQSLPLHFKTGPFVDYRNSRMFEKVPADIENILKNENVTHHFHRYCITEKDLRDFDLDDKWRVISTNQDNNGLEFISSVEHKKYPLYGLQFHPEKNAYEFTEQLNIDRSESAIKASHYLALFFVGEAKKSNHRFINPEEECRHIIYNFPVTFTGLKDCRWYQAYLFTEDADYPERETLQ